MSYIYVINIEATSVEPSKYDSRELISFKSLLWASADEVSSDVEEADPLLLNKAIALK